MGIEPPIMSVDPAGLPPFGTPIVVPGLSLPGIDDDDPALSRDQLEIFFDSFRGGNDDLYTAHRASIAEPWTTPVPLTAINTPSAEEHPALSANGLTLYFTSARGGDSNVWMTTRADRSSPFGTPVVVPSVNTALDDRMGSADALDQALFVSSNRAGGSDMLYEARRAGASAAWPSPQLVAEIVTSAGDPSVHVDDRGLVMYLIQGAGDSDLFWTKRAQPGSPWAATIAVTELDTTASESDPWLSPDLRTIYFVRATGPGTKDIFMASR